MLEKMQVFVRSALFVCALGLVAAAAAPAADAQRGRLRATIYLTQHRIPARLTERALIGFARSHNARILRESTDAQLNDRNWIARLIVNFSAPPNDTEFHVLYYDIHDGPRRFVADMTTFVADRTMRTYEQGIRLERPRFRPNRNMELVITVRREEVGKLRFAVEGEEQRHSGTVDFTGEE